MNFICTAKMFSWNRIGIDCEKKKKNLKPIIILMGSLSSISDKIFTEIKYETKEIFEDILKKDTSIINECTYLYCILCTEVMRIWIEYNPSVCISTKIIKSENKWHKKRYWSEWLFPWNIRFYRYGIPTEKRSEFRSGFTSEHIRTFRVNFLSNV